MPKLDRDGVGLYFEVHGSGPAILLTHGYSATSKMWRDQIEALAARHTLILWDMRGHGQSDSPVEESSYSEALTMQDMAALLDHLGFDNAVVGGLSLGGYMSLAFHADYPERVNALLIIDTGPGYKSDAGREAWNQQANEMAEAIANLGTEALAGGTAERSGSVHDDLHGLVRAGRNMLIQRTPRVIESLVDINVPTLVIAGADDQPFLAATDYMAKKIRDARKLIVPDAGHSVNLDQPEVFNKAVLAFLDDHSL